MKIIRLCKLDKFQQSFNHEIRLVSCTCLLSKLLDGKEEPLLNTE